MGWAWRLMARHVKAREKSDGDSAASISAKKNGSVAILHLHSRGRLHRFAAIREPPFSFRSSLATFIILVERRSDERARFVISYNSSVAKQALRIVPLKERVHSSAAIWLCTNIGKTQIHVDDLSPIISPRNAYYGILLLLFNKIYSTGQKYFTPKKIQKM